MNKVLGPLELNNLMPNKFMTNIFGHKDVFKRNVIIRGAKPNLHHLTTARRYDSGDFRGIANCPLDQYAQTLQLHYGEITKYIFCALMMKTINKCLCISVTPTMCHIQLIKQLQTFTS